ncbi:hypothetical protein H310_08975 [Aphanomyces invadans]|uniref:Repressor of RNA polymerase III transcription n=1 Tax=Aphanomyces invadans TaxID=157072 RepID=A0A024TW87_9STRA|nr:hypothetical protein H310_08975 [Aphanomyces invadans]ETV98259.1 hypothetical protein H310_08975 [Aphanomyces invadans]|eukprot:XP_008873134.1 hypothetical protein H310_08975 [Aphanomyces invadans]
MKYLEEKTLSWANAALSEFCVGDRVINGRLECFSCKKAGQDKKLAKSLELLYQSNNNGNTSVVEQQATPATVHNNVSIGTLADSNTRKLLINLISTMNASFPDYDFSDLKPEQFHKEVDMRTIVNAINTQLAEIVEMDNIGFLEKLWESIVAAIAPGDCEVYSYIPDMDGCSDPFSDGTLWSFNYFFYNKELKKILYFTCMSRSAVHDLNGHDEEDDDDDMVCRSEDDDEDDDVLMEGDWEDGA